MIKLLSYNTPINNSVFSRVHFLFFLKTTISPGDLLLSRSFHSVSPDSSLLHRVWDTQPPFTLMNISLIYCLRNSPWPSSLFFFFFLNLMTLGCRLCAGCPPASRWGPPLEERLQRWAAALRQSLRPNLNYKKSWSPHCQCKASSLLFLYTWSIASSNEANPVF